MKQPVSFRGLDDSAHASIEQQIGELAARHLKRHPHPFSTELVSLRAGVESDTLRTGNAYRVKLRVVLSTTTRAVEEEVEHVTAALKTAFGEPERQLERSTSHLLMMDSWRRKARRDNLGRLKTVAAAGAPEESARFREQMSELFAPVQRIARRELAYMRERGDLSSDFPTLVDVIDKTLARAFPRVREHPGISIEEGTLGASCCRSRTTKQCAADATEKDVFRLNLAAPLSSFGPQTKSARRSADFRIPATRRNAQGRRRAAR